MIIAAVAIGKILTVMNIFIVLFSLMNILMNQAVMN